MLEATVVRGFIARTGYCTVLITASVVASGYNAASRSFLVLSVVTIRSSIPQTSDPSKETRHMDLQP
jgi:hypothetical protein